MAERRLPIVLFVTKLMIFFSPNALSDEVFELDQLSDIAEKLLSGAETGNASSAEKANIARRYIANTGDETACRAILDAVDRVDLVEASISLSTSRLAEAERNVRRQLRPLKHLALTGEAAGWNGTLPRSLRRCITLSSLRF